MAELKRMAQDRKKWKSFTEDPPTLISNWGYLKKKKKKKKKNDLFIHFKLIGLRFINFRISEDKKKSSMQKYSRKISNYNKAMR